MKITPLMLVLLLSACAPLGKGVTYSDPSPTPSVLTTSTSSQFEVIAVETDAKSGAPQFDEVRVTGLNRQSGNEDLIHVTVSWRGRGAGTFQIDGPAGTMLADAVTLPENRVWFRDVRDAKPFSELMSRGLVFGETDPDRLKTATLEWLNRVVAPAIEPHLKPALARP